VTRGERPVRERRPREPDADARRPEPGRDAGEHRRDHLPSSWSGETGRPA